MHISVMRGDFKMAKALIDMAFPILLRTKFGLSPVDLAIIDGKLDFVELLVPEIKDMTQ